MKQKIILFVCLLLSTLTASAYDAEIDGIYYNRLSVDEFEVTYGDNKYTGDLVIPEIVEYRDRVFKIVQIGNNTFYNCTSLTSISIPLGVSNLPTSCFEGCTNLTKITIPQSVTTIGDSAFRECNSLLSLDLPKGLQKIEDYLFYGCSSLTSVSISQEVTSIGISAFEGCSSLLSLNLPDKISSINETAFCGCTGLTSISLPDSLISLGERAFEGCNSLKSIILPEKLSTIAQATFKNCTNLTSATLSKGLTSIGNNVFDGCICLTSINLPDGLYSIGEKAFLNCSNLITINIPKSVQRIGADAFSKCIGLKKVIIKDMSAWCKIAFASAESNPLHYAQRLYSDENTEIKDFYIPQKVTRIGNYAFYNAEYLSRIYIMNSTPPSIGANTFGNTCYTWTDVYVPKGAKENYQNASYWSNFKAIAEHEYDYNNIKINGINYRSSSYYSSNVEVIKNEDAPYSGDISLPETITFFGKVYSVTAIGANAFQDCTELTSVVIPQSVTLIRDSAFQNCTGLTSIRIPASVNEIGNDAFKDCTGLAKVIVPDIAAWCRILFKGESNGWWSWTYANPLRYAGHLYADNDTEIKNLIIPNEVTYISEHAFGNCSYIESVTIPNSVKSIGEAAFQGCTSLTSITIPNSVTQISKYAFSDCSSLETVTLSENITRINDNLFYYCTSLKNITIPQSVTYIAYQSFCECKSLTTITIPSKVSYIGFMAFSECSKLNTVVSLCETPPTLGKSNGQEIVFDYSKQVYLLVPQGCKENYLNYGQDSMNKRWGTYSFSGIFEFEPNKGEYLVLYSSLGGKIVYEGQEISNGADAYMVSNGESISLKIIADDGYELSACKIDGDSIKEITRESDNTYSITLNADRGHHVDAYFALKMYEGRIISSYSNNRYLYYKVLPNYELEVCRFYDSYNAMYHYVGGNVVIPDSVSFPATLSHPQMEYKVTSIDKFAFMGDNGSSSSRSPLLSVVVGNNITSINDSTFLNCKNLTSVTLGERINSIGTHAFEYCNNLTSINIPSKVTNIGNYAFRNDSSLTSVTIPNSVTFIGESAFEGCSGLTSIVVESGNATYDSRDNCNALIETATNSLIVGCNSTIIPNSVTSIGEYAFYGCSGLTSITIPNSVTSIEVYAFSGCSSLTEVYCYAKNVPRASKIRNGPFRNTPISSATLYVPAVALETYKTTAPWSGFGTIVALDEPTLRGDVNGDDVVNGTDIQAIINLIVASEYDEKADVNKDSVVNGTDIQEVINIIVNGE